MKILITGSSGGIGKNIRDNFLKDKNTVIGLARDHRGFTHKNYISYDIDLSKITHIKAIYGNIAKTHQDIDVVIINAGLGDFKELEQFSDEQVLNLFNVNVVSQILLVKSLIPNLKKQKNKKIIFIGSEAALDGANKGTIYCSTKFALRGFAQSLRKECNKSNVAVTIINPGMVKTDFYENQNFTHGDMMENYILPDNISDLVKLISTSNNNFDIDEINLSPMKKVVRQK